MVALAAVKSGDRATPGRGTASPDGSLIVALGAVGDASTAVEVQSASITARVDMRIRRGTDGIRAMLPRRRPGLLDDGKIVLVRL